MSLSLVKPDLISPTEPLSGDEKIKILKGEVYSGIEDRMEALRAEALAMRAEMDKIVERIDTQGFQAFLEDLRTGKWYKLATEIQTLQEVANALKVLDGGA